MGINLEIYNIKQQIIDTINTAKLPISIVCMILNEIYTEVKKIQQEQLIKEAKQEKQTSAETTNNQQDKTE